MTPPVLAKMETLRKASSSRSRISLTELARSTKWRDQLAEQGVLEIMDRTETAAFLLSPTDMDTLLDAIAELEAQVEQAEVEALVSCRATRNNWQTGDVLASNASASLKKRRQELDKIAAAYER